MKIGGKKSGMREQFVKASVSVRLHGCFGIYLLILFYLMWENVQKCMNMNNRNERNVLRSRGLEHFEAIKLQTVDF